MGDSLRDVWRGLLAASDWVGGLVAAGLSLLRCSVGWIDVSEERTMERYLTEDEQRRACSMC
jgi:hypothetical protein